MKKIRNTCTTRHRFANMRRLAAHMATAGAMTRDEACSFLCLTVSGGRKYLADLTDVGVLSVTYPSCRVAGIYTVHPDPVQVEALIAAMEPPAAPAAAAPAELAPIVIRPLFRIPTPDPLLAHLFGRAA